jgi:sugar-phosphatase
LPVPKHLLTSTDVVNGKPDPEPYLKGAAMLKFPAADCLVLEDVPAGIQSGKAAGARVLAVRTTYSDDDLAPASPDWIVEGLSSICLSAPGADGSLKLLLNEGGDPGHGSRTSAKNLRQVE